MLVEAGHEVVVIDRMFFETTLPPEVRVVKKDTRAVDVADFYGVDRVIDLAGISNDPSCDLNPALTIDYNFRGGLNVARCAYSAGVESYVYASSCAVYGQSTGLCGEAHSALNPLSEYARSKVATERALTRLWKCTDFGLTIFRLSTVYGLSPRMRFDLAPNLMALRAWQQKPIEIWSAPDTWRPFVHVRDVARIIAMDNRRHRGMLANLGSSHMTMTVADLAQRVAARRPTPIELKVDTADARSYRASFTALGIDRTRFEFTTLEDGIDEILAALDAGAVKDGINARTVERYKYLAEWRLL
jgi:nucleoside-diphosphate-sugar epimerase